MSIYLDERIPARHKPFDDASPDIVGYVRVSGSDCWQKREHGVQLLLRPARLFLLYEAPQGACAGRSEMKEIDPKGLDTAFWGSVTKEDIYEYLYF